MMDISTRDTFKPIELAIALPKGYAVEFKHRDFFNQIYFGMLSMDHDLEGFRPIVFQFEIHHNKKYDTPLPDKLLLTFYHPEKIGLSQLIGLVILGGQPDIYNAYQNTKSLTPFLESILIDKHPFANELQKEIIQETLSKISQPIMVKPLIQILETSERKKGEKLASFFPILDDPKYHKEKVLLPTNFRVDAAFIFKINPEFFSTHSIGGGLKNMSLYVRDQDKDEIEGRMAFPLIVKWQPVYNDILAQLKLGKDIGIPEDYEGKIVPSVTIFNQKSNNSYIALISNITEIGEDQFYNVAIARSGDTEGGKPLSFLQSALSRGKFGENVWKKRMKEQDFSEDALFINWKKEIDEINLDKEGRFDIGLLRSLKKKR